MFSCPRLARFQTLQSIILAEANHSPMHPTDPQEIFNEERIDLSYNSNRSQNNSITTLQAENLGLTVSAFGHTGLSELGFVNQIPETSLASSLSQETNTEHIDEGTSNGEPQDIGEQFSTPTRDAISAIQIPTNSLPLGAQIIVERSPSLRNMNEQVGSERQLTRTSQNEEPMGTLTSNSMNNSRVL